MTSSVALTPSSGFTNHSFIHLFIQPIYSVQGPVEGFISGKDRKFTVDKIKYQLNAKLVVTQVNKAGQFWETSRRLAGIDFYF